MHDSGTKVGPPYPALACRRELPVLLRPVILKWGHSLILFLLEMNFADDDSEDASVIHDILAGDINAFETLIDRYQDHVAQIVRNHVPWDKSPEVAHDTFVQAYLSLGSFKGTGPFKHWLSKIAVRCCCDFWRGHYKTHRRLVGPLPDECHILVSHILSGQSLQQETERVDTRDLLQWALGQLSPSERTVLTLTYLNDYSLAESAELLGWSIPRVKTQAHWARRKLRKIITKILPPSKGKA